VFLTDLIFIEDGNKDNVNDMVNFDKRRKIAKIIQNLRIYQSGVYKFKVVDEFVDLMKKFEIVQEKEIYKISLEIEPREIIE
jgi:ACT domain-containing protein